MQICFNLTTVRRSVNAETVRNVTLRPYGCDVFLLSTFYDTFHFTALHRVFLLKMASSFWKGIVGVGLFALAHAAFSAAQREFICVEWMHGCRYSCLSGEGLGWH